MDFPAVKRQNLRVRVAEDDGGMRRDDELRVFVFLQNIMDQHEKAQLPLRGTEQLRVRRAGIAHFAGT